MRFFIFISIFLFSCNKDLPVTTVSIKNDTKYSIRVCKLISNDTLYYFDIPPYCYSSKIEVSEIDTFKPSVDFNCKIYYPIDTFFIVKFDTDNVFIIK
jgi:hypothetical protein